MLFKNFRILFTKSTISALFATKNNSIILKAYKQSSIEQLGMCTVRLRHKDKDTKCRIFVVSADSPALWGMLDINLLNILMITCEVLVDPHEVRKFNSQTIKASNSPSCKTNKVKEIITDNVDVNNVNENMPDCLRPNSNRAEDK